MTHNRKDARQSSVIWGSDYADTTALRVAANRAAASSPARHLLVDLW